MNFDVIFVVLKHLIEQLRVQCLSVIGLPQRRQSHLCFLLLNYVQALVRVHQRVQDLHGRLHQTAAVVLLGFHWTPSLAVLFCLVPARDAHALAHVAHGLLALRPQAVTSGPELGKGEVLELFECRARLALQPETALPIEPRVLRVDHQLRLGLLLSATLANQDRLLRVVVAWARGRLFLALAHTLALRRSLTFTLTPRTLRRGNRKAWVWARDWRRGVLRLTVTLTPRPLRRGNR